MSGLGFGLSVVGLAVAPSYGTALAVSVVAGLLVVLTRELQPFGFLGMYGVYLVLAHLGAVTSILVSSDAFASFRTWQVWAARTNGGRSTASSKGFPPVHPKTNCSVTRSSGRAKARAEPVTRP